MTLRAGATDYGSKFSVSVLLVMRKAPGQSEGRGRMRENDHSGHWPVLGYVTILYNISGDCFVLMKDNPILTWLGGVHLRNAVHSPDLRTGGATGRHGKINNLIIETLDPQ